MEVYTKAIIPCCFSSFNYCWIKYQFLHYFSRLVLIGSVFLIVLAVPDTCVSAYDQLGKKSLGKNYFVVMKLASCIAITCAREVSGYRV